MENNIVGNCTEKLYRISTYYLLSTSKHITFSDLYYKKVSIKKDNILCLFGVGNEMTIPPYGSHGSCCCGLFKVIKIRKFNKLNGLSIVKVRLYLKLLNNSEYKYINKYSYYNIDKEYCLDVLPSHTNGSLYVLEDNGKHSLTASNCYTILSV